MNRLATPLAFVALAIAVIALILNRSGDPTPAVVAPAGAAVASNGGQIDERLDEVVRELDRLRAQLALLGGQRRAAADELSGSEGVGAPEALMNQVVARLSSLEDEFRIWRMQDGRLSGDLLSEKDAQALLVELEQSLEEARGVALSPTASEEEKLIALRGLRYEVLEDGSDARTPDVVAEMIRIAQSTEQAAIRADVWRQLDGVTDPFLLQPLLDSLAYDTDSNVREEAAETLGSYMPDGQVEAALRYAMENDANEGVREQARNSLN